MDRLTDEANYVMGVLYQMRDRVIANQDLSPPDALEATEKEITFKKVWSTGPKLHDGALHII